MCSTWQCVYSIIMCVPAHFFQWRSIRGQSAPHPPGSLVDGLTLWPSLGGTAWFSTPRAYGSHQSVSPAFNGTPATPVSHATHASALSALTAKPSPCNWLLFRKAWMFISVPSKWVYLTSCGLVYAHWIHSDSGILFLSENEIKGLIGEQAASSYIIRFWHCSGNELHIPNE